MTHTPHDSGLDAARRSPSDAAGCGHAPRRRSELWEFLGMTLAASGLVLAVVHPDIRDDVVHTLASRAVALVR